MSRNEMFLLLACALAVAILTGGPVPPMRPSSVAISSLFSPPEAGTVVADTANVDPGLPHW